MIKENFNLVRDPWIRVINQEGQQRTISLSTLFTNAGDYQRLAGEMVAQDLAVLRFLLAIITTVYSRINNENQPYEWIKLNDKLLLEDFKECDIEDMRDSLIETWNTLYKSGNFSAAINDYLKLNITKFDFFGDKPFYQVNKTVYDSQVATNKKIDIKKQKGTVSVKQINRTLSESNNSPAIFSPKSEDTKNDITVDQLIRWIIAYQNYTGVTDKTKVVSNEKFSVSAGWLYGLNPVYAEGKNLFETLMLNFKPDCNVEVDNLNYLKPFWEFENITDYVDFLKAKPVTSKLSIPAIYTVWSRMLHIEWVNDHPIIFSAGLPKLDSTHAFSEPMTTWHHDKKSDDYYPNTVRLNSLSKAMWRSFGQYVKTQDSEEASFKQPGIVSWLNELKNNSYLPENYLLTLKTANLISDGNATSQSPIAENVDSFKIRTDVLFDNVEDTYWPDHIEDMIDITQTVGKDFWSFANNIGGLQGLDNKNEFANRLTGSFYDNLNQPFLDWMKDLKLTDRPPKKKKQWLTKLKQIAITQGELILKNAAPRDIIGIRKDDGSEENIFIYFNWYKMNIFKHIKLYGGIL